MSGGAADPTVALERAFGWDFKDRGLLTQALTHRSYAAEFSGATSYERLEFLGDAVLELAVTQHLFGEFAMSEGEMTKVRAAVVNEPTLASLARHIGVPAAILLGPGEETTGGRNKDSILSDVVEALLGVVFLEGGFTATVDVVARHWGELVAERSIAPGRRDFKTRLQEEMARRGWQPEYTLTDSGPEHAKQFLAVVRGDGEVLGEGRGTSKKRAEQEAAQAAVERLTDA